MTANELIEQIAEETRLEKSQVRKALQAFSAIVAATIETGDNVPLPGLGQFKVRETDARQTRHPATGEMVEIPATRKLTFSMAKSVKEPATA